MQRFTVIEGGGETLSPATPTLSVAEQRSAFLLEMRDGLLKIGREGDAGHLWTTGDTILDEVPLLFDVSRQFVSLWITPGERPILAFYVFWAGWNILHHFHDRSLAGGRRHAWLKRCTPVGLWLVTLNMEDPSRMRLARRQQLERLVIAWSVRKSTEHLALDYGDFMEALKGRLRLPAWQEDHLLADEALRFFEELLLVFGDEQRRVLVEQQKHLRLVR